MSDVHERQQVKAKGRKAIPVLRLRGGGGDDDSDEEDGDDNAKESNDAALKKTESTRKSVRQTKLRRDSFLIYYHEACASDSGSDSHDNDGEDWNPKGDGKVEKSQKKDSKARIAMAKTTGAQFSPEIQRMMTKLKVTAADCSKQKQRLDTLAASLAIHRWARKTNFSLQEHQLSEKHFNEVLALYGRQGSGLIITTSQSLKKCWMRDHCENTSKLHNECILCDEKTWDDYEEEANAGADQIETDAVYEQLHESFQDTIPDNLAKCADKEIQTEDGDGDKNWMENKEIQTESFSGEAGALNSVDVAQIQQSLIEMAAKLQQKEAEIVRLKGELEDLQKSEGVLIKPILPEDVSEEAKQKCHLCAAQYLNYGNLTRHYKDRHPDVKKSDIPVEQKQANWECQICGNKFMDKQMLVQHHRSVHAKEECQYCHKSFGPTNIKRHEEKCAKKGTSGLKKTQCPHCKDYIVKLARHLETCKRKNKPQGDFLTEDDAEIKRLKHVADMAHDMEETAAIIASRINMSLCRGVSSAARGQCLFECGSDQILHRVLWLAEEEGEENPLMFQELIDDIGMENLSAQSIREGTVDLLSNNEMAFERFPIETPGDEILPEEVRRERYAEEMEQLRRGGEYAMGAGDLMADGMSAFLGLYIIMLRSNTPDDHPIQLHIPQTMGGTLRHDMPLLVIYSENRSHYEEARPADMDSDQKLLFVEEIFLENNHWPYRYNRNDRKRKPQPDKDDDVPTPKRRKLFSLKSPAVPEVFSQEEEGEASSAKNAGKSSCKPQERGKKRDRSPSPTDGQPESSNAALTTLRHVQGSLDAASNVPDKTNNQDVGSSRKMRKYEEELQKNLSPPEQQSLSIFRGQLNQAVADLPAFREELNEARLGNDTIIKLMSDFKDIIDGDDVLLHVQKKKSGTKKPETIKHWLTQLKGKILPFLHHKYPGIDLNILVDFKEEIEHDNYHRSDPPRTTKLFMLSETDIRESLNSTYNYLPNPGPSKHQLVMAWIALFRAIAKHAKSNRNWFSDRGDAQYTISNYDDAADAMAPAIKRFKGQAAEKRAEDELKGKTQPESVQLTKGVHNWYNSEQREKYRQTLAELADAKAVPTKSQYIQCLEFVHTEMIVSSPFRNAVWKGFPYRALAEASIHPGWDPSDVSGRDEETIETVIEDGYTFKLTADISRPPPSRACEHQRTNPSCTCPDACPPCGYNVLLTWDKGNKQATKNRYLHLPKELWEVIMQFARIRDNYFSCVLKNGPTGNQPSDWFKGNCPLLLNSAGKPNNAFTMSMASRVMQMDVTPHMFRKLFCTFLAHHEEESVRSAQSQVCGQSTSIFQQYYNLNKKRDAQTLIQLLQSWRTDPDVPSDSNSNWDEENQQRLLEEVKRLEEYEEEVNQVEDVIDTHSFKNPIMKAQLYLLLKIATRMDLNITVSHPNFDSNIKDFVGVVRLTKETWKMRFLKLAMRDSTNGETLRQLLLEIFKGREEPTRHKWSVMESMMTRQQSAKGKGKEEPQLWDSLWVLVDTIFSSVSAKVKAVSSISEDILYRECSCESLPKTLACIHCKKPVCNRCCR